MTVRILVIDDDAVACEFLQEALSREGYEVRSFTSAEEALREHKEDIPRLILCTGGGSIAGVHHN